MDKIAPLQRGFDLPTSEVEKGEFPVVYSNGISRTHIDYKAKAPGIVTGRSGTIGSITFVTEDYWPHNTSLWVTDFFNNEAKFVYYFYHTLNLERYGTGSGVPTLNRNDVHSLKKCIPEKPEQQKIASFLSAVDKKIEQLSRKKELLEEYKKGVMQKLFPKPSEQHPELRFKDENGEDFPDWEVKKLGKVSKMNPRSQELPEKFVYIDLESVEKGRLLKEEEIYLKDAPSRAQRYLSQGDILFQTVRPYQMNNYLFDNKGEYVASSGYAQIKPIGNRSFLFHYLHHQPIVNLIIRWSTGSSFPAISPSDLTQLPISFPNIKEQNLIAGFLDSLFQKINTIENEKEQTQTFKKGLLQQMFV